MNVEIANRLMQMRKKKGLSQEELAEQLGVSRQAVSKWECAESSPDTDNLIALSKIYGVTLDELINGAPDEVKEGTPKEDKKKEDRPFFHIKDEDGDEVTIGPMNIHVTDEDGSSVHIDSEGIHVNKAKDKDDDDVVSSVHIDKDGIHFNCEDKDTRVSPIWAMRLMLMQKISEASLPIIIVTAYLLLGFLLPDNMGWSHYWFLFFAIPVVPSLFKAIRCKRFTKFALPVLVVGVYCGLCMFIGLWHILWLMFLIIPIYYSIFGPLEKHWSRDKNVIDVD